MTRGIADNRFTDQRMSHNRFIGYEAGSWQNPSDHRTLYLRDYRCWSCQGKACITPAPKGSGSRSARVTVLHKPGCEFWSYIAQRWPKLAESVMRGW